MPGCDSRSTDLLGCSHNKAPLYFSESILNKNAFQSIHCEKRSSLCCLWGYMCKSYINQYMGFCQVNKSLMGSFYLETRAQSPYSKCNVFIK